MKVYRVYNSIMTADGDVSIEECGVFASQAIAIMTKKALDTYNLELQRLEDANCEEDEAGNLKSDAVVSRVAVIEPTEIVETLEQVETAFMVIQKRMDLERKLYSKEQD